MKAASRAEVMAIAASREIGDGDVVFVGIGLPNLAVNLARLTHAPHAQLVYEAGVYGARPDRLPISIGDPALVTGSIQVMPMADTFSYLLQGGRVDVGFLGAAQIDRFGNLNTTMIGTSYARPKVRLPGAGGAPEIATHAKRTIIMLAQSRNKFPQRLDFRTTVGFHQGGETRLEIGAGLGGPKRVITNMGVYGFDPETREMILESIHPEVSLDEVRAEVAWDLRVKDPLPTTTPPDDDALRMLREELDPKGIYLGGKQS